VPVSAFDLFKVGIGPSSSHTVGPMRIALQFVQSLQDRGVLHRVARVEVHLYGSLALTGRGHGTDRAVLLGLMGQAPDTVDIDAADSLIVRARERRGLALAGLHAIDFHEATQLVFHACETLPQHPNGMRLLAEDDEGNVLADTTMFSIGGGFVAGEADFLSAAAPARHAWAHPYRSAAELLQRCRERNRTIAAIALENELTLRTQSEVEQGLDGIRRAMFECMDRGLRQEGFLPGVLKVRRRARELLQSLEARNDASRPMAELDWVNAFAVAVNEENAAGGRVVTAPTNGAAGIIPAVLRFYEKFCNPAGPEASRDFLLTAAAIGSLYKENASISGAEVGCQGEVGVASSMAAAGLAAALGASNEQIENAAEIGMEHNLGLTCDPVGGLVQIPCIERNAMGAVKAINAAYLALSGNGLHHVSLDRVIATMKQTGADMHHKYKETSLGGLAVSVVAC
jgi:L-serine dehydratase